MSGSTTIPNTKEIHWRQSLNLKLEVYYYTETPHFVFTFLSSHLTIGFLQLQFVKIIEVRYFLWVDNMKYELEWTVFKLKHIICPPHCTKELELLYNSCSYTTTPWLHALLVIFKITAIKISDLYDISTIIDTLSMTQN